MYCPLTWFHKRYIVRQYTTHIQTKYVYCLQIRQKIRVFKIYSHFIKICLYFSLFRSCNCYFTWFHKSFWYIASTIDNTYPNQIFILSANDTKFSFLKYIITCIFSFFRSCVLLFHIEAIYVCKMYNIQHKIQFIIHYYLYIVHYIIYCICTYNNFTILFIHISMAFMKSRKIIRHV